MLGFPKGRLGFESGSLRRRIADSDVDLEHPQENTLSMTRIVPGTVLDNRNVHGWCHPGRPLISLGLPIPLAACLPIL